MKLSNFIDGINILRPYYADQNGYHIGAEHDEFYMYATDKPLSDEDLRRVLDLGWFQPEDGADEESPQKYDPKTGWNAFI